MNRPYRHMPVPPVSPRRTLDQWKLALLFAWVMDIGRIGIELNDRAPIAGEVGFAAVLVVISAVMGAVAIHARRESNSRRPGRRGKPVERAGAERETMRLAEPNR